MHRRKLPERVVDGIIADYKRGLTLIEIADKWNVTKCSVYPHLKKRNIKRRRKQNFYTKADIKKIIDHHKSGLSRKEIAKKYNISSNAVYHILKRRGFEFEIKRALSDKTIPQIVREYKNGKSLCKLARKYRVAVSTIERYLKKSGIKIRNRIEAKRLKRKRIKIQKGMTRDKAKLFGFLLSDGSERKDGVLIHNSNNLVLLDESKKLAKRIYGIEAKTVKDRDKIRNEWSSINILEDLHKFVPTIIHMPATETHVPKEIMENAEFAKAFLKYYFSSDGCIILGINSFNNIRRLVNLESRNPFLLNEISLMLNKFEINHGITKYAINISSKSAIFKFKKLIGFLSGVKIRKGTHWIACEKAKLLNLTMKTFQNNFQKRFSSTEDGYNYLKEQYKKEYE